MTGGSNFSRSKIFQLLLQLLGSRPACDFRRVQSTPAWSRSQLGSRCWVRRNAKYIFCSVFVCHLQRNALNASFVPLMLTLVPLHWCWHSSTIFPCCWFICLNFLRFLPPFQFTKAYLWRRNSPQATLIMRNREELRTKHQSAFLKSHGKKPTVHLWRDPPIQTLPLIQ